MLVLRKIAKTLDTIEEPVKLEWSTVTSKTTVVQSQGLQLFSPRDL